MSVDTNLKGPDGITANADMHDRFASMSPAMLDLWYDKIYNGYCKLNNHRQYLLRMYFNNPDIPVSVRHEADMYREMREEQYDLVKIIWSARATQRRNRN